jgi:release factor glutamine methyltransferase
LATIAETIRALQQRFTTVGIGTPRLDAEVLIGHALGLNRTQLLANLRDPVPVELAPVVESLAERRVSGEPVAYILGRKEFLGHDFVVSPAVLTPRPETELLVEWAVQWLSGRPDATVIDVGTGSGAIAIAIARNTPGTVSITAVDVSEDALAAARVNADRLCPGRISFQLSDLLTGVPGPVDLVLANLPYLRPDQIDGNQNLVAEPRLALDGGRAGLDLIKRLISQLPRRLAPGGAVALEIDPSQSEAVVALLAAALPRAASTVHRDLAGLDRFVTCNRRD